MSRFFITIRETVQLVLKAAPLGNGGEIFVIDMGDPVKLTDLARDLIGLSGLEEGEYIEIRYSGIRPGEELCEEVLFGDEDIRETDHAKVIRAQAADLDPQTEVQIVELLRIARRFPQDEERLRDLLVSLVPDFHAPEKRADVLTLRARISREHRRG